MQIWRESRKIAYPKANPKISIFEKFQEEKTPFFCSKLSARRVDCSVDNTIWFFSKCEKTEVFPKFYKNFTVKNTFGHVQLSFWTKSWKFAKPSQTNKCQFFKINFCGKKHTFYSRCCSGNIENSFEKTVRKFFSPSPKIKKPPQIFINSSSDKKYSSGQIECSFWNNSQNWLT